MRPLKKTTSTIGNPKGFTFVEVMVALVVLSAGITGIYKSFFICVDYLHNITCRIYASHLIDAKIADISRSFAQSPELAVEAGAAVQTMEVNRRPVDFHYDVSVAAVKGLDNLYQLKVALSWPERNKTMNLSRSAYISKR